MTEVAEGDENVFIVQAFDAASATYPGIRIMGKSKSSDYDVETDESGTVRIPPCDGFTYVIPWLKQSWKHEISLEGANRFTIRISEDQMHPELFIVNEKWLIQNKMLYFVDENGMPSEYGMKRVNKREEKDFVPD